MGNIRAALLDAIIGALPIALVYFAGWAYLSSYLGEFGIDATQVELPFTTVLVYAFKVLPAQSLLFWLGAAVILIAGSLVWKEAPGGVSAVGFALLCVVVYFLLLATRNAALDEADKLALAVWRGDKSPTESVVVLPAKPDPAYDDYLYCRNSHRLRQVIGLPDRMFLFCRSERNPDTEGALFLINDAGAILYVANRMRRPNDETSDKQH